MNHERHVAFIGLGANLGNPLSQCRLALEKINQIPETQITRCSSFYKSDPLVPKGVKAGSVPEYINAVCEVLTELTTKKLLNELLKIEKEMGRTRREKWESRLIDLDLLSCDTLVQKTEFLTLPHPEIHKRRFVLEPLKEIAPSWSHPESKKTVSKLLVELNDPLNIERIRR